MSRRLRSSSGGGTRGGPHLGCLNRAPWGRRCARFPGQAAGKGSSGVPASHCGSWRLPRREETPPMGLLDRLMGRGKKAAGDVTGDASLRREGMHQEAQVQPRSAPRRLSRLRRRSATPRPSTVREGSRKPRHAPALRVAVATAAARCGRDWVPTVRRPMVVLLHCSSVGPRSAACSRGSHCARSESCACPCITSAAPPTRSLPSSNGVARSLEQSFKALSAEALDASSRSFLELAKGRPSSASVRWSTSSRRSGSRLESSTARSGSWRRPARTPMGR